MKKQFSLLVLALVAMLTLGLSSCSNPEQKVNDFVEMLNGQDFKNELVKTGLFVSSDAKIANDSIVELTLNANPTITFQGATQAQIDVERENMIKVFKTAIPTNAPLKECFEAMKATGKSLKATYVAPDGSQVFFVIAPSDVLGE